MALKHITHDGKKISYYIGMDGLGEFYKGEDMEQLADEIRKNPFKYLKKALFIVLQEGAKMEGVPFKMKPNDLTLIADGNPEKVGEIWREFNEFAMKYMGALSPDEKK